MNSFYFCTSIPLYKLHKIGVEHIQYPSWLFRTACIFHWKLHRSWAPRNLPTSEWVQLWLQTELLNLWIYLTSIFTAVVIARTYLALLRWLVRAGVSEPLIASEFVHQLQLSVLQYIWRLAEFSLSSPAGYYCRSCTGLQLTFNSAIILGAQ